MEARGEVGGEQEAMEEELGVRCEGGAALSEARRERSRKPSAAAAGMAPPTRQRFDRRRMAGGHFGAGEAEGDVGRGRRPQLLFPRLVRSLGAWSYAN